MEVPTEPGAAWVGRDILLAAIDWWPEERREEGRKAGGGRKRDEDPGAAAAATGVTSGSSWNKSFKRESKSCERDIAMAGDREYTSRILSRRKPWISRRRREDEDEDEWFGLGVEECLFVGEELGEKEKE